MKTKIQLISMILFLGINSSHLFAQIDSIDVNDFKYQYTTGNKVYSYLDKTTTSVNIGSENSSSWDFSNLHKDVTQNCDVINPVNTPYRPDFPKAQFTWEYTNDSTQEHNLEYYCHSQNVHLHGLVFTLLSMPGYVKKIINHPEMVYAPLPMIINETKKDSVVEVTVELQDADTLSLSQVSIVTRRVVDAYGPITFPNGKTRDALRVKSTQKIFVDSVTTVEKIIYQWFTKDGEALMFETSPSSPDTGVVDVTSGFIRWVLNSNTTTDVADEKTMPEKFQLNQNYPNPFNPATTISYSIPADAQVKIKVFNIIGKEVANLADEQKTAGSYSLTFNAGSLPSGVYFLRMNAGSYNKIIKMTFLK